MAIKYPPGTAVRVTRGIFAGRTGTVVDKADPLGKVAVAGCCWVKLYLNPTYFTAHLREDELEPIA